MIENQIEIDGICELKIMDEQSILIKSPKFELLTLSKGEATCLNVSIIHVGETFNLSDADHISEIYTLVKIHEGSVILEAELTFTGVGIPENKWNKKKLISIKPYISQ